MLAGSYHVVGPSVEAREGGHAVVVGRGDGALAVDVEGAAGEGAAGAIGGERVCLAHDGHRRDDLRVAGFLAELEVGGHAEQSSRSSTVVTPDRNLAVLEAAAFFVT